MRKSRLPRWVLAGVVYFVLAAAVTFPVIIRPDSTVTSIIGYDVTSSITKFEVLAEQGDTPFEETRYRNEGWPYGVEAEPNIDRISFLSSAMLWLGAVAVGSVAAHGFSAILGYALSALVMCAAVRSITRSEGAGFIAGIAYGFWPYMYSMSYSAAPYVHMWIYVLPLWAFTKLGMQPSAKRATIAALSAVPGIFWTPYYALHVNILVGAALLALLGGVPFKHLARAAVGVFAADLLFVAVNVAGSFSGVPTRAASDAYQQSIHPLMLLFPRPARELLIDVVPRAAGMNLYVGLSVLVLAGIGVWRSEHRLAVRVSAFAAGVCLLCGVSPTVWGIPMPSRLVVAVSSGFRAGHRLMMPLMAALVILAGLGAQVVLKRVARASPRSVPAAIAVISIVVFCDLWFRPPNAVSEIPERPALEALGELPPGPAVHYQLETLRSGPVGTPCLYAPVHHKPLVNACSGPVPEEIFEASLQPGCEHLGELYTQGVRYVIVDRTMPGVLACVAALRGAAEIAADDATVVYEVTASGGGR